MNKKRDETETKRLERFISDKGQVEIRFQKLILIGNEFDEKELSSEVKVFKALADENRLRILKLLREGELCACELTVALSTCQSTVSHHLSVLKNAGLIKERKEGKWSYFRLSDGAVIEMLIQVKLLVDK